MGDTFGIVEHSVMVAQEKLHCSYLDGTGHRMGQF